MLPDDNSYAPPTASAGRAQMSEIAFSAALGAAMMLFVGFGIGLYMDGPVTTYSLSVNGFTWIMKVGGALMGLVAVLLWAGLRPAIVVDTVLATALGGLMIVIGAVWMAYRDFTGILLVAFGAIFIRSGWGSWMVHRSWRALRGLPITVAAEADVMPPPSVPVDGLARQAAMDRLLAGKKRELPAGSVPPEADPAPEMPAPPPPKKEPPAPPPPPPVRPLARDEPPPEGFLADLGRDDSERK